MTDLLSTATAYWKFDEGTGASAFDSTGNGHVLSLVGASWADGLVGGAVTADGIDDYLVSIAAIDFSATSAITLSLWSNRMYVAGPNHTLVELSSNYNQTTSGFGLFPDDTEVGSCGPGVGAYIGVRGDTGYTMNCYTQPSSNVWHHLAMIFDKTRTNSAEVVLYVDGIAQSAIGTPYASDNTNAFGVHALYLFSRGGTQEFNAGAIDELAVFSRALTPAEISLLD